MLSNSAEEFEELVKCGKIEFPKLTFGSRALMGERIKRSNPPIALNELEGNYVKQRVTLFNDYITILEACRYIISI